MPVAVSSAFDMVSFAALVFAFPMSWCLKVAIVSLLELCQSLAVQRGVARLGVNGFAESIDGRQRLGLTRT